MDLKEFVSASLTQIAEGVRNAQEAVLEAGGVLNPALAATKTSDPSLYGYMGAGRSVFLIEFDLAVIVTDALSGDANARLSVAGFIKGGAGVNASQTSATENRLRFKVPLTLPTDPHTESELKERLEKLQAEAKANRRALGHVVGRVSVNP